MNYICSNIFENCLELELETKFVTHSFLLGKFVMAQDLFAKLKNSWKFLHYFS